MKITILAGHAPPCVLQVGTAHHPYPGQLPEVGQTIVIPEDAKVDDATKGKTKVVKIVWHYNTTESALWPELVCRR